MSNTDHLSIMSDTEEGQVGTEIAELISQRDEINKLVEDATKNGLRRIKRDARNSRRHRESELNIILKIASLTDKLMDKVLDIDKRIKLLEQK